MSRIKIKICGITCIEDAALAADLGADFIGLNLFPGSKRHITPTVAKQIALALPPKTEAVLLVVNQPLAQALPIAENICRTIQWHGDDPPLPPDQPWQFIPAFNIVNAESLEKVTDYLNRCRAAGKLPAAVLLDGHAPGHYGGTGSTAPWQLLADFQPGVPIFLAGGLTPANVAEAIRSVRPFAVDVSSGVEISPGRKEPAKLRLFFDAVAACSL